MPWLLRGLRDGVVTTRYPARPDDYGDDYRAAVAVAGPVPTRDGDGRIPNDVATVCPTSAITTDREHVELDRGRCILCGRCVDTYPTMFQYVSSPETSRLERRMLVVPDGDDDDAALAALRQRLSDRVRALRRSVHVRHVDAGSDGADEWEIAALTNPVYDVQRLGIFFTATPRHADLLLVTGAGASGMRDALRRTLEAMPAPTIMIAVGTDAISGGLVSPSYVTAGGLGDWMPVDVWVPGSPPSPFAILHGILLALDLLPERRG
jgi:Ni,Fe-hydrogenase III small subunit/ferredoxin